MWISQLFPIQIPLPLCQQKTNFWFIYGTYRGRDTSKVTSVIPYPFLHQNYQNSHLISNFFFFQLMLGKMEMTDPILGRNSIFFGWLNIILTLNIMQFGFSQFIEIYMSTEFMTNLRNSIF